MSEGIAAWLSGLPVEEREDLTRLAGIAAAAMDNLQSFGRLPETSETVERLRGTCAALGHEPGGGGS